MAGFAHWCFPRRRLVFAGWLVALALLTAVSHAAGISYATRYTLPNSPSAQAIAILQRDFPPASGDADQIVVEARTGAITSGPARSEVGAMLAKVKRLPRVASVTSPYAPRSGSQVSRDGKIAFATVNFDAKAQDLPSGAVSAVIQTAQAARGPNLKVELTGQAIENAQPQKSSNSTALGVILALIVLGLAFGALFAAITPIVTAPVAIGIGYDLTGLLTHVLTIVSFTPILGVLIGLGVGVDYALLIVTRHRSGVRAGRSIEDAAVHAVSTAGRAVFFAGLTVVIALLGQFALGVSFLDGAAVAAAVTVALTMLASLTLLPALLGFIGPKVLSRRERRRISESGRPGVLNDPGTSTRCPSPNRPKIVFTSIWSTQTHPPSTDSCGAAPRSPEITRCRDIPGPCCRTRRATSSASQPRASLAGTERKPPRPGMPRSSCTSSLPTTGSASWSGGSRAAMSPIPGVMTGMAAGPA